MNFKYYDPLSNHYFFAKRCDKLYQRHKKFGPEFGVFTFYNRHSADLESKIR